ncbi:cobalamin biosynthesis protein CobW [Acuticoccus sp. I52.16.1]|uniref:cobalamin biosynthesis protein CobW n=1 Tax=Acuticoccus sp. I52.16.1 TaxID=2928472 RepID=UPI001FD2DB72|nr:cobalamin biosynthesis protein CobW [Acuticoccus sp. I52.16.1]UOM33810.1 cobalamin biosynthesis protein CobW [Acuticoccus sp. I52.16.1]
MRTAKIPATVITGFLGAGKTTLIRHLLENAGGRRIALIINEFGDLGVDGEVLKGCGIETCTEDDVIELTNGCICCTVADDFVPTMTALLDRAEQPDHIVIETSGLALPQPLVQAFNWPGITERVTVDGVVTVVDAAATAAGLFAHDPAAVDAQRQADPSLDHDSPLEELFEDQLRAADLVVLNKVETLDRAALDGVKATVTAASTARHVVSPEGRLPAHVLLGLGAATETLIATRKSHHELEHADGEEHDHDDFTSFVVEAAAVDDPDAFVTAVTDLVARHDILRLKGFVDVPGKPMRLVVQGVGRRISTGYDRLWQPGERATRLVVIAQSGVDEGAIRAQIAAATGATLPA